MGSNPSGGRGSFFQRKICFKIIFQCSQQTFLNLMGQFGWYGRFLDLQMVIESINKTDSVWLKG